MERYSDNEDEHDNTVTCPICGYEITQRGWPFRIQRLLNAIRAGLFELCDDEDDSNEL